MITVFIVATGSVAQALTASTSVTIVNVTSIYPGGADVRLWPGAWPNDPNDVIKPEGYELYINKVNYTTHYMNWNPTPYPTPYPSFSNTVNSMIAAVYSRDGGKNFMLISWDYLQPWTTGKGTEAGMPDCWMGAMVHTICDRKPGECNGRYRSNLYFSEWPTGNTNCWASRDPQ